MKTLYGVLLSKGSILRIDHDGRATAVVTDPELVHPHLADEEPPSIEGVVFQ